MKGVYLSCFPPTSPAFWQTPAVGGLSLRTSQRRESSSPDTARDAGGACCSRHDGWGTLCRNRFHTPDVDARRWRQHLTRLTLLLVQQAYALLHGVRTAI